MVPHLIINICYEYFMNFWVIGLRVLIKYSSKKFKSIFFTLTASDCLFLKISWKKTFITETIWR